MIGPRRIPPAGKSEFTRYAHRHPISDMRLVILFRSGNVFFFLHSSSSHIYHSKSYHSVLAIVSLWLYHIAIPPLAHTLRRSPVSMGTRSKATPTRRHHHNHHSRSTKSHRRLHRYETETSTDSEASTDSETSTDSEAGGRPVSFLHFHRQWELPSKIRKTYSTPIKSYNFHCAMNGFNPPFPATMNSLGSWIDWLSLRHVKDKTVKAYLAGVEAVQVHLGFEDSDVFRSRQLKLIRRGARRLRGT